MANISGCLSEEIQTIRDHSHLELGSGLMTIQTVLGEGLVNAYGLWGSKPRGPHLLVDCKMEETRGMGFLLTGFVRPVC
jgi:hypothetical protein